MGQAGVAYPQRRQAAEPGEQIVQVSTNVLPLLSRLVVTVEDVRVVRQVQAADAPCITQLVRRVRVHAVYDRLELVEVQVCTCEVQRRVLTPSAYVRNTIHEVRQLIRSNPSEHPGVV